jgi:RNA recognition motif-containing protein
MSQDDQGVGYNEDRQGDNNDNDNQYNNNNASNDQYDNDNKSEVDDIAGKVFIGGLSWSTTEQTLRYYFEKYGELSDVALMVDKRTGKPRYEERYSHI